MMWFIVVLIDTILKGFQYGCFFIVPIILVIIILIYKRKNVKNFSFIIKLLIGCVILTLLTSRMWGPNLYRYIIGFYIDNKESLIEEKLERKYTKNFTFVSKEDVILEDKYAGSTLDQDINMDYSIKYRFKDDDGVIAIVKYKKNVGFDYYASKRKKYYLEKCIFDYANKIGFNEEFYVVFTNSSESINSSNIDSTPYSEDMSFDRILLILPKSINGTEEFMTNALKSFSNLYVHEYIVTEDEYKKAVMYYESERVKNGIEEVDYEGEFKFNKNEIIDFKYYSLK